MDLRSKCPCIDLRREVTCCYLIQIQELKKHFLGHVGVWCKVKLSQMIPDDPDPKTREYFTLRLSYPWFVKWRQQQICISWYLKSWSTFKEYSIVWAFLKIMLLKHVILLPWMLILAVLYKIHIHVLCINFSWYIFLEYIGVIRTTIYAILYRR